MPTFPSNGKRSASSGVNHVEILEDFTYLSRNMKLSHSEIMRMPHNLYLAYLKHNRIFDLKKTEEGREYLEKARKFNNPRKHADISTIRSLGGYSAVNEEGDQNGSI